MFFTLIITEITYKNTFNLFQRTQTNLQKKTTNESDKTMILSETPKIELIRGDCMEFMKDVPDKYYELAIVDPPYGIGEDGRQNHTRTKLAKAKDYRNSARYDNSIPDFYYFQELFRVSKNQIIWGGNYYIEYLKNTPCVVVWDKDNGENDFADCELAWTSFDTAVRKFKYRWNGMLQENMKDKEERIHPNQKPIQLYKWLLATYAKTGDKIIDTHAGSFNSGIACYKLGFEIDAFEIDAEHYDAAIKRFKLNTSQLTAF